MGVLLSAIRAIYFERSNKLWHTRHARPAAGTLALHKTSPPLRSSNLGQLLPASFGASGGHRTLRHQDTLGHFSTGLKTLRHQKPKTWYETLRVDTSAVIEEKPGHFDPEFRWDTAPPVIRLKLRHQFCDAENVSVPKCLAAEVSGSPSGYGPAFL